VPDTNAVHAKVQRRSLNGDQRLPADELVLVLVGVLRTRQEGMTTYEIVDVLADEPSLPAQTRQGRFRQLERILRSATALEKGIVAAAPEQSVGKRGRPPKKVWRLDLASRRPSRPAAQRAA
jgi:hypothetical protein